MSVQEGIDAVRTMLPRIWFDRENCADGIEALKQYRTEYNDKRQVYSDRPLHDWSSDYADSVRYFAITHHRRQLDWLRTKDYSQLDKGIY